MIILILLVKFETNLKLYVEAARHLLEIHIKSLDQVSRDYRVNASLLNVSKGEKSAKRQQK